MVVNIGQVLEAAMSQELLQGNQPLMISMNVAQRANFDVMFNALTASTAGVTNFARQWDRPETERYRAAAQVMENIGREDVVFVGQSRSKKRQRK